MTKDDEIESILHSLDGIERSAPRPFFFTRLEARLQSGLQRQGFIEKVTGFVSRPIVALAAIAVIIFINTSVVFLSQGSYADNQSTTELASFDEYIQLNADYYDLEK